jgi:hypothetical protein
MKYEDITIVVARYNEDLAWTREAPFDQFRYLVYNKGNNEDFDKTHVSQVVTLPNVGRCDHTYLHHVIANHDRLTLVQVFFTGSMNLSYKKAMGKDILTRLLANGGTRAPYVCKHIPKESVRQLFKGFQLSHWTCTDKKNQALHPDSALQLSPLRPFGRWYQHHFGDEEIYDHRCGGVFAVDARDIQQHPPARYEKLMEGVAGHSNPEEGHYIERSWAAIFGPMQWTELVYRKE